MHHFLLIGNEAHPRRMVMLKEGVAWWTLTFLVMHMLHLQFLKIHPLYYSY